VKIYLAYNYATRFYLRTLLPEITALGHEVTSRWITDDSHDKTEAASAVADLQDIDRAEALLLFVDQFGAIPGRGKYVELGYAIGTGKKVFLYGSAADCVFYCLPWVTRISNFEELR
jgi:nucleoside 2-deoxyribosyltransferase